jgi:hypothetical protein
LLARAGILLGASMRTGMLACPAGCMSGDKYMRIPALWVDISIARIRR